MKQAPDFKLTGIHGVEYTLKQYRGKWVVLEWTNPDCPYVRRHYDSGNMQAMQRDYTARGVIWLTICSSAMGREGSHDSAAWKEISQKQGSAATAILLDPTGEVGRAFGAESTPHMFCISPEGQIVYQGGVDDKRSKDPADVATARNYVREVLDAALAKKPIPIAEAPAFGCSVKY
jgi:alkyl hydroperoxide reductase subunit AhpC